jgi:hypothetical protein
VKRLNQRLTKLEADLRNRRWTNPFEGAPPYPSELYVNGDLFQEAFELHKQGRAEEFSDEHRQLWRIWERFERDVAASGALGWLHPDDAAA